LSNDDRKSTVFSWRRNVVSDGAFLTDDGRLFHARAEATGVGVSRRNSATLFGMEKLEWLGYLMVKKIRRYLYSFWRI